MATSRLGYIAKFFPQDWFADNISLTDEQFGVYMRMVFRYWSRDGLPFSPEEIAEEIGSNNIETIKFILGKRFKRVRGKRWVHEWLDAARTEVRDSALRNSGAGLAGSEVKHIDKETKAGLGYISVQTSEGENPIKAKSVATKRVASSQPVTNNVKPIANSQYPKASNQKPATKNLSGRPVNNESEEETEPVGNAVLDQAIEENPDQPVNDLLNNPVYQQNQCKLEEIKRKQHQIA